MKKMSINNPALSFISAANETELTVEEKIEAKRTVPKKAEPVSKPIVVTPVKADVKETVHAEDVQETQEQEEKTPEGEKLVLLKRNKERLTKRIHLMLTETNYIKLYNESVIKNMSVNSLAARIFEEHFAAEERKSQ